MNKLNSLARENGYSLMAAIAAQRLLIHVAGGGFLGANADHYCFGTVDDRGCIIQSGFDVFTEEQRREALQLALEVNPGLWEQAEENFDKLANEPAIG